MKDNTSSVVAKLRRAESRRKTDAENTFLVCACRLADKGSLFGSPFIAVTKELALKAVKEVCPSLPVFHLGYFRATDGKFVNLPKPYEILG